MTQAEAYEARLKARLSGRSHAECARQVVLGRRHITQRGGAAALSCDDYVLRVLWRFGGYGGGRRFPGVRKALRAVGRDFALIVRVAAVALALPWLALLGLPARLSSAVALVSWPSMAVPPGREFLEVCPATGPPASLAAPGALVIDP